jgi:hypothetical protein
MRELVGVAVLALVGCSTGSVLLGPDPLDAGAADRPDVTTPGADAKVPSPDVAVVVDVPAVPLQLAQRDLEVTPTGGVRQPSITFHPASDAFVTAYTWVLPDVPTPRFRVEARGLAVGPGGSLAVGAPVQVDGDLPAHDAGDPAIAASDAPDGPALVVWVDDRAGPGRRGMVDVYGRLVRPTGGAAPTVATAGVVFDISSHAGTDEALPAVAWDASVGVFLVAWSDDRERGVRHEDARVVYARFVAPDLRIGPEQRLGDAMLFQTNPSVASCGDGRFLVAWTDYRHEGTMLVSQARGLVLDARAGTGPGPTWLWGESLGTPQDLVAAQCAPDRDGWWIAWGVAGPPSIRQLRVARLASNGSLRTLFEPSAQPDGARAARLASVPATGQVVLTQLAQDSTRAYGLVLAPGATAFPAASPLTPAAPRLGTFWSAVAASTRGPTAVAVTTLDYDRLRATTFAPP